MLKIGEHHPVQHSEWLRQLAFPVLHELWHWPFTQLSAPVHVVQVAPPEPHAVCSLPARQLWFESTHPAHVPPGTHWPD